MTRNLFSGVRDHQFSEDVCFLCGDRLADELASVEHVVPKWLQNKFNLWNVKLDLLNGTGIPYKNLVIPCCYACNNEYLSAVEDAVSASVLLGAQAVREMDGVVLMQWLLKMFFGFLYREVFLQMDRRQPDVGTIVSPADMEQFQMLHYMLQSVRIPMRFSSMNGTALPASIFVFDLKEPSELKWQFDYGDDVIHRTMFVRMGRVGIIAAFDMGAQALVGSDFFSKYMSCELHPIQFAELAANLFAKARTLLATPKIMFAETPSVVDFTVLPFSASPARPLFDDMSLSDFAMMLSVFIRRPISDIEPEPGKCITYLRGDNEEFLDIPLEPA